MDLTIDYETRSPIEIKKCGGYVYANCPYTEIMMLAVKINDEPAKLWIPPTFEEYMPSEISVEEINQLYKEADTISAHNAPFERWITKFQATKFGMDELPLDKMNDTAVQGLRVGLPKDLETAVKILFKGRFAKDKEGKNLINVLCKPRKFLKADWLRLEQESRDRGFSIDINQMKDIFMESLSSWALGQPINPKYANMFLRYKGDKETFCRFGEYARTDVDVERALYKALPKISKEEHEIWQLDQIINDRGVRVDRDSVIQVQKAILKYVEELNAYGVGLTNGHVTSMKSSPSIVSWLRRHGVDITSVAKESVVEVLESHKRGYYLIPEVIDEDTGERISEEIRTPMKLEPVVKEFLEVRQQAGKSSSAKYEALKLYSSVDERCHGMFVFNGAQTGRWAGAGPQPQNFPRPAGSKNLVDGNLYDTKEFYAEANDIDLLKTGDTELAKLYWKDIMVLASDLLRPMLISAEGYDFVCADYSAIEARGLAYLAGEEETLQVFRDGKDVYKFAAMGIYGVGYDEVDSYQRQVGKTCVLALGYGGGYAAMLRFGADKLGINSAMGKDIVKKWREANSKIKKLWYDLVECSKIAFRNKGVLIQSDACPSVSFICKDKILAMNLPSGRKLYYLFPKLEEIVMPWSTPENVVKKTMITALTTENKQARRRPLNHLILSENLTQAFCNDLLRHALLNVENYKNGKYINVMHVHDEIVCECLEGNSDIKEFEDLICQLPSWAEGLPIKAEGWVGKRYRK